MNLIQQAVARAEQTDKTNKFVFAPLEPAPNLGRMNSRSFRSMPMNPGRTPLAAIGLAVLALLGGAALYIALAHSRDESAAVTALFSQVGLLSADKPAIPGAAQPAVTPAAAAPVTAPTPAVQAPAPAVALPQATVAPQAAAASQADQLLEARYTIDAWARAWSQRDVDAYLTYYGDGFAPERGTTRAAWEKARRQAIERRNNILVTVNNLELKAAPGDRVVARYTQDYAADAYRESGTPKRLVLAREGGVWRIVAETGSAAKAR